MPRILDKNSRLANGLRIAQKDELRPKNGYYFLIFVLRLYGVGVIGANYPGRFDTIKFASFRSNLIDYKGKDMCEITNLAEQVRTVAKSVKGEQKFDLRLAARHLLRVAGCVKSPDCKGGVCDRIKAFDAAHDSLVEVGNKFAASPQHPIHAVLAKLDFLFPKDPHSPEP